jgi:Phosphoenolpyruvate carboxykinase
MQLAAVPDSVVDSDRRPRPYGRGRLLCWRLEQNFTLPTVSRSDAADAIAAITAGGLDPAIARNAEGDLEMAFGQIARFAIRFADRTVQLIEAHADADQATIDHLLDDHVAPRIIAADGSLVLHGSASLIGGRIAVFLGLTGSGKSTLSASLHARGYQLLGDDAVVIGEDSGTFTGEAVYPSLRLYRESIDQVLSGDIPTAAMAFYSDKQHVRVSGLDEAGPARHPIGGIYVLADGKAGIALDRYSPSEGCMALLENSFALDPSDGAMAARRMGMAARVAAQVPCYELAYPYDFSLLDEIGARVVASLAPSAPPA